MTATAPIARTRRGLLSELARMVEAGELAPDLADEVVAALDAGLVALDALPDEAAGLAEVGRAFRLQRAGTAAAWVWDAERLRYVTTGGAVLHPATLRRVVERTLEGAEAEMRAETALVAGERFPIEEWEARMEAHILERHVASAAAARGGIRQMTGEDRLWVRAVVEEQYRYLDGFSGDLTARVLSPAQIEARLALYNVAARSTFEEMRGRVHAEAGYSEERWVLGGYDDANCAGCLVQEVKGWRPLGSLPPIGSQLCIVRCRCHKEFRR